MAGIHEEVEAIRKELNSILEDTLIAGLAVGEMRTSQKSCEQAGKELGELVGEVQRRIGGAQ